MLKPFRAADTCIPGECRERCVKKTTAPPTQNTGADACSAGAARHSPLMKQSMALPNPHPGQGIPT